MPRPVLSDDQWERIKDLLPGKAGDCGVGSQQRITVFLLKPCCGLLEQEIYQSPSPIGIVCVYVRYSRLSRKGVWTQIWEAVSDAPDLEYLMVDGSIVRVHQHGASKKTERDERAQGKSRGGLSTKIHLAVDALGNPIRFLLTLGQASEYGQAN